MTLDGWVAHQVVMQEIARLASRRSERELSAQARLIVLQSQANPVAVQVFFCKFREGDFSVVVITLSG